MNDVTVTKRDITAAVREAAMLAEIHLSMWEASQHDSGLMEEVKEAHGAKGDVGRVIKYLMSGADSRLKSTRNAFRAVRDVHKKLTLPWISHAHAARTRSSVGLLPHLLFPRYNEEVGAARREAYGELDMFIAEYPDLVIQAKGNLGSMVTGASYPTPEQVRGLFRVDFDFTPVPSSADFSGLDEHMLERLGKRLETRYAERVAEAEHIMWSRVREPVQHLLDMLGDDQKPKAPTVEHVRDLLVLLPGWNVTGNPQCQEIADQLADIVDGLDAKDLREDAVLRASTKDATQKVVDRLNKWGL